MKFYIEINNTFRVGPFWGFEGCPILERWLPSLPTIFRLWSSDLGQYLLPKPTFFGIIYYKRNEIRHDEFSNPNKHLLGL